MLTVVVAFGPGVTSSIVAPAVASATAVVSVQASLMSAQLAAPAGSAAAYKTLPVDGGDSHGPEHPAATAGLRAELAGPEGPSAANADEAGANGAANTPTAVPAATSTAARRRASPALHPRRGFIAAQG